MEFETPIQQSCYEKVASWMDELFTDIPWEKLDVPGFGLFMGSAWVEVLIVPWKDDSLIAIRSTLVSGAIITPALQTFLLNKNAELLFGAFALNSTEDIIFSHTIIGSTCDELTLETCVKEVLSAADEYDDEIVALWGGQRALDRSPI